MKRQDYTNYTFFDYEEMLYQLLQAPTRKDRTGVGTQGIFGAMFVHDMREGFPLITTKKVWWHGVLTELLWFLKGDTNIQYLWDHNVHIWDEWADKAGNLGPVYGKQWRDWNGHDQLSTVIDDIKQNPFSRRLIVSAWNVSQLGRMALPPCHLLYQFYCDDSDGEHSLDLQMYQRSADVFLGVPFNIASYATLLMLVAAMTNRKPRRLTICFGDLHLYSNHVEQAKEQSARERRDWPTLTIEAPYLLCGMTHSQFKLDGYDPHAGISAPIAV